MLGPLNLITDVRGLRVGNAEDARLRSGVTVVVPDEPAIAAVDVRGGGHRIGNVTRETRRAENVSHTVPITELMARIDWDRDRARDVYAEVQELIRKCREQGQPVPEALSRIEHTLSTEMFCMSQGR